MIAFGKCKPLLTLASASPYLFFSFKVYSPVSSCEHLGTPKVTVVSVNLSATALFSAVNFSRLSSTAISSPLKYLREQITLKRLLKVSMNFVHHSFSIDLPNVSFCMRQLETVHSFSIKRW